MRDQRLDNAIDTLGTTLSTCYCADFDKGAARTAALGAHSWPRKGAFAAELK